MASLRILVPDGTTNYVKNPSLRFDTTGWTAFGSSISRSLERSRFGYASLKIVTNGAAIGEGSYYRMTWLQGVQSALTASVYLRGSGKVRIRLSDNLGRNYVSDSVFLNDLRWKRLSVTGRCSGGNDIRLTIETSDSAAKALTIYADAAQVEPHEYMTTYCDGDQPGCFWNILQHGSVSTRSATTRAGGRWVSLAGCGRDSKNLYMTVLGGLGAAPITNHIQSYADAPGSYFQNIKVLDRAITISFFAKSEDLRVDKERSLRNLHELRQQLFEIIRPDKTAGNEEFVLEYQDGDFPLYVGVRYESGLEGSWDIRNSWVNSFPVRFLSVSPLFSDDSYETASIAFKSRITTNYIMGRFDGQWSSLNGGMNSVVYDMTIGRRGEIIAVGGFTRSNYLSTAIDPMIYTNCVAYWDGTQWQRLGTGVNVGSAIYAVSVAPNGDIYVGGNFTQIGGVSANRIARWDATLQTWNALGTGTNDEVYTIKIAPNGYVYVGGQFTTAGGLTARYCAFWDGSSWHPLGAYLGMNNSVYTMSISPDGTQIVMGGLFTDEYSSPGTGLNYITLYDAILNTFAAMGSGFDAYTRKVFVAPDGIVYVGGNFTSSGGETMLRAAFWNGATWHDMAGGADNLVRDIAINREGNILMAGYFTRMGSTDTRGIALWTGSTWVNLDADLASNCYAVAVDAHDNIFLAPLALAVDTASITTVNVKGTCETNPQAYLAGPCNLRWIENQTTKKRIYIDLDILTGEEVTFDFGTGKVLSSLRGDLSYTVLPGSDMHAWTLLPGENKISALAINDTSATFRIYYAPRHWSADATADAAAP